MNGQGNSGSNKKQRTSPRRPFLSCLCADGVEEPQAPPPHQKAPERAATPRATATTTTTKTTATTATTATTKKTTKTATTTTSINTTPKTKSSPRTQTILVLVDVQQDFHPPNGSLAIPGAGEDAKRIAALIRNHSDKIDRIVATLDSHHKLHIAHPGFWVNDANENPPPFTLITHQDILEGKWKPKHDKMRLQKQTPHDLDWVVWGSEESSTVLDLHSHVLGYTRRLEQNGRFKLCVWPEHCLIGTRGHNLVEEVSEAIQEWSIQTGLSPEFVYKGSNNLTEMYSALAADVPVNQETKMNHALLESLTLGTRRLLVCGQAQSHCVNYTLRDIMDHWKEYNQPDCSNVSLLTDCSTAVPSFEEAAIQFQNDMQALGVVLCTSDQVFASE